jgi:hypothetical protein
MNKNIIKDSILTINESILDANKRHALNNINSTNINTNIDKIVINGGFSIIEEDTEEIVSYNSNYKTMIQLTNKGKIILNDNLSLEEAKCLYGLYLYNKKVFNLIINTKLIDLCIEIYKTQFKTDIDYKFENNMLPIAELK